MKDDRQECTGRPGPRRRVTLVRRLVGWCAVALVLQGCALAPGPHFDPPWSADEPDPSEKNLPDMVKVHEIGPSRFNSTEAEPAAEVDASLERSDKMYDYVVGPGDVLNITIYGHPELTIPQGSARSAAEAGNWVHSDGTIFYPYVGKIEVAGLRVSEVRKRITNQISEYIEEPQIEVTVASFRSKKVYVTGAVSQPGTFPITNVPMRLLDAISAAGGVSPEANWRDVTLIRNGNEYELSLRAINELGNPDHNVLLQAGDVVHIARSDDNKIFVLGEVYSPKPVPIPRSDITLAGALAEAGGLDKMAADASGIFVMRKAPEKADHGIDVYQLNANNATALVLADQFRLEPRDIVYVTAAPIARWNRVLRSILPTVSSLYLGSRAQERLSSDD